jgi:hypothetical protein
MIDTGGGPPIEVENLPSGYRFTWPLSNTIALVNRITEDRRAKSTSAEVRILSTTPTAKGHLYQGRLNLTSPTAKRTLRQELEAMDSLTSWLEIVEYICTETLRRWREGEPAMNIGQLPAQTTPRYRLYPFIPEGKPAIIYGRWGSWKTNLALALAIMVQSGEGHLNFTPVQGNVLYLDYESDAQDLDERIKAICSGWNMPQVKLLYRFCVSPLEDDLERIQEIVSDNSIALLIVDSVGLAVGGSLMDPEPSLAMMRCLRSLRTSTLLVDHLAKNQNSANTETSPFGTVYKTNLARSIWEVIAKQDPGSPDLEVALQHRKSNRSTILQPIGLKVSFSGPENGETISISRQDLANLVLLASSRSHKEQILDFLKDGAKSIKEMEDELNIKEDTLYARTGELKKKGDIIKLPDGKWGILSTNQISF